METRFSGYPRGIRCSFRGTPSQCRITHRYHTGGLRQSKLDCLAEREIDSRWTFLDVLGMRKCSGSTVIVERWDEVHFRNFNWNIPHSYRNWNTFWFYYQARALRLFGDLALSAPFHFLGDPNPVYTVNTLVSLFYQLTEVPATHAYSLSLPKGPFSVNSLSLSVLSTTDFLSSVLLPSTSLPFRNPSM